MDHLLQHKYFSQEKITIAIFCEALQFIVPYVNSVFNKSRSVSFLKYKISELIAFEIKQVSSLWAFRKKIKTCKHKECCRRISKYYIRGVHSTSLLEFYPLISGIRLFSLITICFLSLISVSFRNRYLLI